MQIETQPAVTEEHKVLQEMVDESVKNLRRENSRKTLWKLFAIVIICVWLYENKSRTVWLPVADSQQMCVVMSDWWGLKVQAYYPVWRKPTGESEPYSEQWCIKYPDNTWRAFYATHGEPQAYKYPPIVCNTYF